MLFKLGMAAMTVGVFTIVGNAPQTRSEPAAGYAWAAACEKCHQVEYDSWLKTKHASALERLSHSEQEKDCLGCHVTGPKAKVVENGKVKNNGIQCEECHGAAAAHVADPTVKTGLVVKTPAAKCEECHNDKGPHFKGFWYDAMKGVVHKTK
jgi:hypothetical protein